MRNHEKASFAHTAVMLIKMSAAALFGLSALLKLFGFGPFVALFDAAGYPPSARLTVGLAELASATLVLTRRFALSGAAFLLTVMIFAIAHVASLGRSPLPLSVGVILAGSLIWLEGRAGLRGRARHP